LVDVDFLPHSAHSAAGISTYACRSIFRASTAKLAEAFNDCTELNASLGREPERVSTVVGREGRIAQRASLGAVGGGWLGYVSSVNALIADLTQPMAEAGRVLGAVAMVDQLNAFASEVTRVAREVGSEGKLGGQAVVKRRRRYVERFDRLGQHDGRQPHQPGP
jgi:hypothetical protein